MCVLERPATNSCNPFRLEVLALADNYRGCQQVDRHYPFVPLAPLRVVGAIDFPGTPLTADDSALISMEILWGRIAPRLSHFSTSNSSRTVGRVCCICT